MPRTQPSPTARALLALCAIGALALTAAACGTNDADSSAGAEVSTTEHNDADVAFASEMIQHHAQALSMVDLTLDRPLDPEVRQLAEEIRDAQAPEIETMTDWLTDWGEEVPATVRDHVNGGHGDGEVSESMQATDSDMPGMMSAEEMTALQDASDADFQRSWLEQMIEHHEGAIEMAQGESDAGRYQPALDLAQAIASSQSEEIETMENLLG